jgi:uncharacterized membrane protein
MIDRINHRPLISAGTMTGIGMGGFADGIAFHQLFQFHNMLSAKYPVKDVPLEQQVVNLEVNMFWDGLFHLSTWTITAIGIAMLWHAVRRHDAWLSTKTLVGSLALGWGLFNLVEGIINHHILHLHHVTEAPNHLVWDLVFLASGVVLIITGAGLIRAGQRDAESGGRVSTSAESTRAFGSAPASPSASFRSPQS